MIFEHHKPRTNWGVSQKYAKQNQRSTRRRKTAVVVTRWERNGMIGESRRVHYSGKRFATVMSAAAQLQKGK